MMYELILASESPRRRQLLTRAGFQFQVHPPKISEILKENLNVDEQILDLARQKAEACLKQLRLAENRDHGPVRLVISADTMVIFEGEALGKPSSPSEAIEVLGRLSGKKHEVKTAVCLRPENSQNETSWVETTEVLFRELSSTEIEAYVKGGEPLDKAGSYGIQGEGGRFVRRIVGSYANVVGLPIEKLSQLLLEKFGFVVTPPPLEKSLEQIWNEIPRHVKVVAVSKLQPSTKIRALYEHPLSHHHLDFGENYVQEALEKKRDLVDLPLHWHFIGHLQSNKAKQVVGDFDLIHSVDSVKLARKISELAQAAGTRQAVLLEINLSGEESKSGFSRDDFRAALPELAQMKGLEIQGLMTMPPLNAKNPETSRPYFRELRHLSKELSQVFPAAHELSMGTSSDYKIAVEEGASLIRLGSILFGERPAKT